MTERIYHITASDAWKQAQASGAYKPPGFEHEGFIHCSYRRQVVEVANRRFHGQEGLVLLCIERAQLECAVIDENLEGGSTLFPHVYGPLPIGAVAAILPFPCQPDGTFTLPAILQA